MTTIDLPPHRLCRDCQKPADAHPWHGCPRFVWRVKTAPPTVDYLAARHALKETA